jgi:putative FmdB family regulatory protein
MPLYEYECDACHHRFEVIQRMSDPLVEKCPKCGATVHKLQSAPAIQFKGSGFYITDYAKKDHVAAEKADKAESGTAESGTAEGGKADKSEKVEQAATSEKSDKAATSPKTDKSGSGAATSSSGDSASSSSSSTAKDSAKGT